MTEIWEKIHKNNVQLIERLDIEGILDHVYQEDVFTDEECELVRAEKTSRVMIRKFLSILKRKSNERHVQFLKCLEKTQPDLAEQIETTVIKTPAVTATKAVTTATGKL